CPRPSSSFPHDSGDGGHAPREEPGLMETPDSWRKAANSAESSNAKGAPPFPNTTNRPWRGREGGRERGRRVPSPRRSWQLGSLGKHGAPGRAPPEPLAHRQLAAGPIFLARRGHPGSPAEEAAPGWASTDRALSTPAGSGGFAPGQSVEHLQGPALGGRRGGPRRPPRAASSGSP
ncbi:unnamed protein product, partial [Rangifer tarandus platyrhynchus]